MPGARGSINVQDNFLFARFKDRREVQLMLVSGKTLTGTIQRFDRFVLLLGTGRQELLVYKHAMVLIEDAAR